MDFDTLEQGLQARGFVCISSICNLGMCNKDSRHFVLLTDGLLIYTTYWDAHMSSKDLINLGEYLKKKNKPNNLYNRDWDMESFNFKELNEVMGIVDA